MRKGLKEILHFSSVSFPDTINTNDEYYCSVLQNVSFLGQYFYFSMMFQGPKNVGFEVDTYFL